MEASAAETNRLSPLMELELEGIAVDVVEIPRRKQAKGVFRNGRITVTVPTHWPLDLKASSCLNLARRILKKHRKDQALLENLSDGTEWISIYDDVDLHAYIQQVNKNSLNATIAQSRVGRAKFSRLAQINLKSRVITVSQFCLSHVPEPALRYLILHELCHTKQANHSPRFWAWVEKFMPNYAYWSDVIAAIHQQRVNESDELISV